MSHIVYSSKSNLPAFISSAPYYTGSSVVCPPLSHQVTQEEVLICPSHAAILSIHSDLMQVLAGIYGASRCYCKTPPAPGEAFTILNSPVSSFAVGSFAVENSQHWQKTQHSLAHVCLSLYEYVQVC